MSKADLASLTQENYCKSMFTYLGKGMQHAAKLYSSWMRQGKQLLPNEIEPQAEELLKQMVAQTDFSLPELSVVKQEGQTIKFLLKLNDGLESETVGIPMKTFRTLCVSSQVGCNMGCRFCETGKMGLIRSLTAKEIVAQLFYAKHHFKWSIRNIVFMGMGEPLDNLDAVLNAITIMNDPAGLNVAYRHITVSTSGHVESIDRLIKEADSALNLAVSVNAPTDEIRNRLMPINRRWNLSQLKEAMQRYCDSARKRTLLIEYVMIQGVNDSLECAHLLGEYLKGLQVKVNLIPYNPQSRDLYQPSSEEVVQVFSKVLKEAGYRTLVRTSKGQSIMAACGQLGNVQIRKQINQRKVVKFPYNE